MDSNETIPFERSFIAGMDLRLIKLKLMDPREGPGWSKEDTDRVETQYRKWLYLVLVHPNEEIVPTQEIDEFWHQHILDTRAYFADTEAIFGHYLHHFPYFGVRSEEDRAALARAFDRTQSLYLQTFNEPMVAACTNGSKCKECGAEGPKCSSCKSCKTGCGKSASFMRPDPESVAQIIFGSH